MTTKEGPWQPATHGHELVGTNGGEMVPTAERK